MDNLEYSNDALEVLSDFYNCDFTVFVEGEDDILFWSNIFKQNRKNVYVEEVGGKEELEKYINKIIIENVNIYVAKDRDYSDFKNNDLIDERILTTYGHSIENTLYNFTTIKNIIKNYCRKNNDFDDEFNTIIEDFEVKIRKILTYDIANDVYEKGISVLGNNTCKFLKNNNSIHICENKITNFIEKKCDLITEIELKNIEAKLDEINKPIWYLVRGHFISNFVVNLIKYFVNKISSKSLTLPIDNLYPLFIGNIQMADEYFHYENY